MIVLPLHPKYTGSDNLEQKGAPDPRRGLIHKATRSLKMGI